MQDDERFRGGVSWRSMSRLESFILFAYMNIPRSIPGLSGYGSHERRLPRVHRGGCHVPRIQHHEPILVSISRSFVHSELTCFYGLVLWQQDNLGLSRGAHVSPPPPPEPRIY